ncbi:hypothetical protein Cri9333_3073 [Crinalium epipsammum PCC 9333]|uniref:DnaD domain-containing protein n=1 Tax=Crinalium epipsammum PCC 9333 TaxID=1173022 RepID=K9W2C6_9CYAN|nr:hypothetical protein [Crinalium epipsammum]AFZ13912.1 hypothetical protein Cri9333_3073 [Crinalium epipsammum PCC 9333]
MTQLTQDASTAYAIALLVQYCFDLRGYQAEELVRAWLHNYKSSWVRLAVIEALYQGRYKAVSVEQILATWNRRGFPKSHFNGEFERLIGRKIPHNLAVFSDASSVAENNIDTISEVLSEPVALSEQVDEIDSTSSTPESEFSSEKAVSSAVLESSNNDVAVDSLTQQLASTNSPLDSAEEPASCPLNYQADWERWEVRKRPIDQFSPSADVPDFYYKLKAANEQLTINN